MADYRLPDGTIPVLLSSHTADTLRREARALLEYVTEHEEVTPVRVADMLLRTRTPRKHRALAVVTGSDELRATLGAVAAGFDHPAVSTATAVTRTVGFVFPGQGSQRPGMARLYYEQSAAFRAEADRCAEMCAQRLGISPLSYLLDPAHPDTERTSVVQPALFVHMVSLAAMWTAAGVRPAAVVGHSQGEIAAGYVAGAMSLSDAIDVVTARAVLVEEVSPDGYSMAVLGQDRESCAAMLARHSGWAELSVVNSPHLHGISGESAAVRELVETAAAAGRFAREIRVAYPAHTSIVSRYREPLRKKIRETVSAHTFAATEVACFGATLGAPMTPDLTHEEYWFWNLRNPVRFDLAIGAAVAHGVDTFIEVAEHPTLMLAIGENLAAYAPDAGCTVLGTSRRTADDLAEFARNVALVAVGDSGFDWSALDRAASAPPSLPLRDFPHTQFTATRVWADADAVRLDIQPPQRLTETVQPPQRLTEIWQPLRERALVRPRRILLIDPFAACAQLADAVRTAAARYGAEITAFDGDYGAERADVNCVVLLLPPMPEHDWAAAASTFGAFLREHFLLPLQAEGGDVWLVTVDGERVRAGEMPLLCHAALAAGFRALAGAHPHYRFRHLDLAADELSAAGVGAGLLAAVHTSGEAELALRGGVLHGKRIVEDATVGRDAPQALDHVLIVGGTGKLGLAFAAYFAGAGAGRVTLLSRSGGTGAAAELDRIRAAATGEVVVCAGDATDPAALRNLLGQCAPVTVIVHTAVSYVHADSGQVSAADVDSAFAAKLGGIENVLREVPRSADCRVLLCSSASATFAGRGQVLYAASNRMLDALAWRLRADGIDCDCVQWGLWQVQGLLDDDALAKVRGAGMLPMPPQTAVTVGLRTAGNAIVASVDWPTLRQMVEFAGMDSLLTAAPPSPVPALATATVAATDIRAGATDPACDIRRELARVMGLSTADAIDSSVPLVALGLDSLQALDWRKRLKSTLELELPVSSILGGASLDDVIDQLVGERRIGQGVR